MPPSTSPLADLPLLQFMPPETRRLVADSFVPVSVSFGETIIREGDEADAFFVLVAGRARVVKRGERGEDVALAQLRPGDSFGEIALVERTTRTATVRASSDVEALRLDRGVLEALTRQHPAITQYLALQIRHRSLHNFLRAHSAFTRLPAPALAALLESFETTEAAVGDLVVREGDEPGPMYVVQEGRLRAFTEDGGGRKYLAYIRRGDFFGERSIILGMPRAASVEAVSACSLLALGAESLTRLVAEHPEIDATLREQIAQYEYQKTANVPLDFAEENLPAEVAVHDKVGPDQVDQDATDDDADEAPFALNGFFRGGRKRLRRFPHVFQVDAMDCGAASMAMVCRHFGRNVSLARIRQLLHTSVDGTSLRALCRGAEALGLAARAVKTTTNRLEQMPMPAIVHWEGNHWMVLYDVGPTHVRVADPGVGLRRYTRAEFEEGWSGYAALFDYTDAFASAPESAPSLQWIGSFLRPHRSSLLQALGLALVVTGLQMTLPVFTQVVVDNVLIQHEVGLLHMVVLGMITVFAFMMAALLLQGYLISFCAVRIDATTLDYLTRRLLALPMRYFTSRRTGDIQRRLKGMKQLREFVIEHGVAALTSVIQFFAASAMMAVYSLTLLGVFLVTIPIYLLLMVLSRRWLRPLFDSLEEASARYDSHQIDAIKGIETVKAMGAEPAFREAMLAEFHRVAQKQFDADFTVMGYQSLTGAVAFLTSTLFLLVGAHQVIAGNLTIGGFVAFSSLVALASQPLQQLLGSWDDYQGMSVVLNRLNDIFEHPAEQGDASTLLPVPTLEGRISLRGLGFRYGGPEAPPILDAIDLEVPPGTMVAIVGRSGSGKTTFIKCLAGLLEPTDGTILYDGIDMRSLSYRDLRRRIGFVLQDNHLFADTIARNIAFGEPEPDMDRVLWAARVAAAHEFIERLPLGYDTRVGESGIAISGGQRQRIAIARAVYQRPPILIFDEATSALDTESERAIRENTGKLLKGRTSFVIAHRLSTIRDADVILVLEKGKLVEHGTHDQLFERQGLYFYLCNQHMGL